MPMKNGIVVMASKKENRVLRRGDIYYANLCGIEDSIGCEQTGRRPVLIIQNDVGNKYSPTTIVAILTTKIKNNLPTHVVIENFAGLSQPSVVCLEQIKTIDKSRLENYRGNIGTQLMREIEKAMRVSLGTMENASYGQVIAGVESKEVDDMELIRKDTHFDNQNCDWIQVAKEQMTFFADIKQYMINLQIKLDDTEEEIENILDYIETTNYNAAQGYKIYRMLRERRKYRKKVVQELNQLKALTEAFECEQMRRLYQSALSKMQQGEGEKRRSAVVRQLLAQEVS